jgi:hypothetical protein
VRDAQAVEGEAKDRVRAALRARHGVVLGRDPHDLADRRLVRARSPQHRWLAADRVDRVVIEMLVGHEHDVRVDAFDRRIAKFDPAAGHRGWIAERVDEDGLLPREQERGLSVPANVHQAASSTGSMPVGAAGGMVAAS